MKKIIILTATYNNGEYLKRLYGSLCNQTDKSFVWIVVDDGSTDDTKNIVNKFIDERVLNINFLTKDNGGKSSAINIGLDYVNVEDFVLIVDADENLKISAIETIKNHVDVYGKNKEIGVIHFHRLDMTNNKVLANKVFTENISTTYYKLRKEHCYYDGYVGYFGYAINQLRFPLFEKEKYVGPSVLIMEVNKKYKMLFSKEIIGETEYLDGGITKQGRRLRVKNPRGMLCYCILLQDKKAGIMVNLKYSLCGYAYLKFSKSTKQELISEGILVNKLNPIMKIPGNVLAFVWMKYL